MGGVTDRPGECNARLFIYDDHGDNHATLRCGQPPGHPGPHQEVFQRDHGPVTVTWAGGERFVCQRHGVQPGRECPTCDDAPITCRLHGAQGSTVCMSCWAVGSFTCPEHGVVAGSYCAVCERSCEDLWVKVFPEDEPSPGPTV